MGIGQMIVGEMVGGGMVGWECVGGSNRRGGGCCSAPRFLSSWSC